MNNNQTNLNDIMNESINNFKQEFSHYQSKEAVLKSAPTQQYCRIEEIRTYNKARQYMTKKARLHINMHSKQEANLYKLNNEA